mmetsp:Transcript_47878/g.117424  ORF Transcript_47878/g.117424 Transcript_47878/m.117424 type:complete len:379 (+) Transcript_47878:58-1194(+)
MRVSLIFGVVAADVQLASFEGSSVTKFIELNDPVMGGESTGSWNVDSSGFGVFDGEVKDVPKLKAPGFIKAAADGSFPDASGEDGGDVVLSVRTTTPDYAGFRIAFASGTASPSYACAGGGSIPLSRGCFKAKFSVPAGSEFTDVRVPLSQFSDKWSPSSGEQTSTCADDKDVCPTASTLKGIKRVEVWAEGADGKVHLEIQSIKVSKQQAVSARPPTTFDKCSGPVQENLRYGISGRTTPTVPVTVDANETLAEAVCCDTRTSANAEPQFLYEAPDIQLFSKIDKVTTFYDSVCGLPLFRAPMNRSLEDFKTDTEEHGWPSFRKEEAIMENLVTDTKTGFVYSKCGTHLGSYLPDAKGPRWCMDLSCVSGNPASVLV